MNKDANLISIVEEMQHSYLDYAMSVIVSRAIPDVCDGLKPVHRRILYSMNEASCYYNKPYRKSARIVGEVMGKYHPHGDSAIYQSLVRMAQTFSMRAKLIDGQGNFGSMDGDAAAAMRYTESRMAKIAHSLLEDIDKDTVDFQDNYDGSEREPKVLPAGFPNILVNGSNGIAVGMATNIPPHNLGEVIDASLAYLENNDISEDELIQIVPGPDFPTGGIILGRRGSQSGVKTGRGSVIIRAKHHIETASNNRQSIIFTQMPYQVNKALILEKIGELVRDKKIEGISEIRDESDKQGVRVAIDLKKDVVAEVIVNQLFNFTQLQVSFGVNMLALHKGRPKLMNLKEILAAFAEFREEVVTRRTAFLLNKARNRAHILIGLSIAVANIDDIIHIIRNSPDPAAAKDQLLATSWPAGTIKILLDLVEDRGNSLIDGKCYFTESQAKAILEMKLSRLTGLEQERIDSELKLLAGQIKEYLDILRSRSRVIEIIATELKAIKEEFATPRLSEFEENEFESDIEDLIPVDDMVVTVTAGGYIKRVPLSTYRAQKRGGKGRSGTNMHEEDVITELFISTTHTPVLFFSTKGKVYKLKVYKLPLGSPQTKGRALVNIFPLDDDETINVVMPLPDNEDEWDKLSIMFATSSGTVRRNSLDDFKRVQSNGKIAMKLEDDSKLVSVKVCNQDDHVLISTADGKAIRFPSVAIREFKSRESTGVRAIKMSKDNYVVSMAVLNGGDKFNRTLHEEYLKLPVKVRNNLCILLNKEEPDEQKINAVLEDYPLSLDREVILKLAKAEQFILTITENGYGKRSSAYEYRITNRGGSGITNIITSARNGKVVASNIVNDSDHIMLITDKGKLIRCSVAGINIVGRNTQGVTIFKTGPNEKVTSVAMIKEDDNVEEIDEIEVTS